MNKVEPIKTWRERIGAAPEFPLHAPTDVERAMVAQIAELEAALAKYMLHANADFEASMKLMSAGALQVGNLMSNVMYELAQQLGKTLERYDCQQMDKLRKDWDAAMKAIAESAHRHGLRPAAAPAVPGSLRAGVGEATPRHERRRFPESGLE